MLIIANNPLSNERELYEFCYTLTIQQNIELHIKSGDGYALFINGEKIDRPEESEELDRTPCFADVVVLVKTQDGIDPGTWLLFAISMVISAASYFLMPKPETPNGIGEQKNSPNSSLTGQTNIARVYQAIPDIYGQIVAYPDLIQEALDEYVDNVKRVTQWMCIGLGKYTVEQAKYGKTPIANMPGGGYEIFSPTIIYSDKSPHYEERGTTIYDVYEPFSFPEPNGQEIVWQATLAPLEPESSYVSSITREYDNRFYVTAPSSEFSNFRKIAETGNNAGWAKIEMRFYNSSGNYMFINDEARLLSYASDGGNYIYTIETKSGHEGLEPNYNVSFYFSAQTFGSYYDNPSIGPFISPVKCDQVWFNIAFPRGMKGTCGLSIFVELIDDNGNNPYPNLSGSGIGYKQHDYTISLDTYSEQYITIKTDVGITIQQGAYRYKVRIARKTPDNADSTTMAKVESIKAINYYAQKTYRGVTLARFTINATEQATSGQENKFNALVTRHVRTIDNEGWGSVDASRDATRAICHMFTVMAGESGSDIDYDALTAIQSSINSSNPSLGYFDWSFDDKDLSLGERLKTAANAMRCAVFRDGVKWSFWRDQLSTIGPVMQFDYRNLAAAGDSQIGYNGILPSSYDGVELEYADPTENKKAYIRLRINADRTISVAQDLSNALKVQLAGCRNYAQANNRAQLEAMKLIYQNEVVTDTALQDAAALNIGDVVRWIDPNDFETDDGMFAGEIMEIDGFSYETSEPIDFGALTGRVMITGANGVPVGPYTCTKRTDGKNGFIVAQEIGDAYTADGYNIQSGSRYCVMVGVSEQQIQGAGLYVLTDKKPNADGTVGITLVNYNPVIYTYDGD